MLLQMFVFSLSLCLGPLHFGPGPIILWFVQIGFDCPQVHLGQVSF